MTAYTVKTLAERWAVSIWTIYDLIGKGEIKTFKVGRSVRISAEEVSRFENNK